MNRPLAEQVDGRGLLRDDGRVVAHGRAGHVGHQLDPLGGLCHRAERRPSIGRVPLAVEPRRVVVADDLEVEAGLLGPRRVAHELDAVRTVRTSGCIRYVSRQSTTRDRLAATVIGIVVGLLRELVPAVLAAPVHHDVDQGDQQGGDDEGDGDQDRLR